MKLGKFATSIERVSVRVTDTNGPRGGVDQVCNVKVVLSGLPSVVVERRNAALACRHRRRAARDGAGGSAKCSSQAHEAASREEFSYKGRLSMVNISAFCAPLICPSSHAMPFITRSRSQDGMKPKSPSSTSTVPLSRRTGHGDARKRTAPAAGSTRRGH